MNFYEDGTMINFRLLIKKFMRAFLATFLLVVFVGCKKKNNREEGQVEDVTVNIETKQEPVKFKVYDYDGIKPILNREDDKTYIVNFWATWCKPCIEELPDIEKVYTEYKEQNVELILVSLDMPSMWKSKLEPFVNENNLKGTVVILDDPKMNDWIPKIDSDWDGGIPASLIYNANKRQFYAQGFTYDELKNELDKFL